MTTLTDDFNRADGDIGASWTDLFDLFVISGNEATGPDGERATYASDLASTDHYVQAKVAASPSNWGLTARVDGSGNYYLAQAQTPTLELYKQASGFTELATTGSLTISDGDVVKLECNGTALKIYENGIERVSATNGDLTTGLRGGMRPGANNQSWDDFEAADLGGGGAAATEAKLLLPANMRGGMGRLSGGFQ